MKPITLYTIADPRTAEPFYVGISHRMDERQRHHRRLRCASTRSTVRAILKAGAEPTFTRHGEFLNRRAALKAETAMMRDLHSRGFDLCNVGFRSTDRQPD